MATQQTHPIHREELHRAIVSESPNAIFLVDAKSRQILEANPATLDLLGYESDDIEGLLLDQIDLTSTDDLAELVDRVVRTHNDFLGERTLRTQDGTMVPVEASANLIICDGREVVCYFARDITVRRRAAEERQRLHRALALSQKHEAVGRLAAGIAHDFNNQLMVMMLCAEMVGHEIGPAAPGQTEIVDLLSAGRSAAGLIRQLLAFSGQQVLRPKMISPDDAIEQQRRMLARTLGEDIRIVTEYGSGSSTVLFDQTQFEQVIVNLAVNARDAMPRGGTFEIRTREVDVGSDFTEDFATLSPGRHVLLTVADTGVGMDEETLSRLFEPFFTTKSEHGGTGLGLATVYGIIKQSGGSIWASSAPDEGTTFRIFIPVADGEQPKPPPLPFTVAESTPTGTEAILVVDDDQMVRILASRILRDLGYSVFEAAGSEEAVDFCVDRARRGGQPIDLILSDVVMPGTSGPAMIRQLVSLTGVVRVIFMSGYATQRIGEEDLTASDFVLLSKPLGRSALAKAVRTALDR